MYERAAVLLGAAGLWWSMAVTLDGVQHLAGYQRDCYRQTRQALGAQAWQAAYNRGLELPSEDAFALQQSPKPSAPAVPAVPAPTAHEPGIAPLTPREMQVARLLAGGRSNKEIAAQLVISQRTAGRSRGAHPHQAQLRLASRGSRVGRRVATKR